VIQPKHDSKEAWTGENLRCFLCDVSGRCEPKSVEEEWVRTPAQCLDRAIEGKPGAIVVCFGLMPIQERETLKVCETKTLELQMLPESGNQIMTLRNRILKAHPPILGSPVSFLL
jgi:hypothetical protein